VRTAGEVLDARMSEQLLQTLAVLLAHAALARSDAQHELEDSLTALFDGQGVFGNLASVAEHAEFIKLRGADFLMADAPRVSDIVMSSG
jgi:hypothetical protein